jgi:hypothetical protein
LASQLSFPGKAIIETEIRGDRTADFDRTVERMCDTVRTSQKGCPSDAGQRGFEVGKPGGVLNANLVVARSNEQEWEKSMDEALA